MQHLQRLWLNLFFFSSILVPASVLLFFLDDLLNLLPHRLTSESHLIDTCQLGNKEINFDIVVAVHAVKSKTIDWLINTLTLQNSISLRIPPLLR